MASSAAIVQMELSPTCKERRIVGDVEEVEWTTVLAKTVTILGQIVQRHHVGPPPS